MKRINKRNLVKTIIFSFIVGMALVVFIGTVDIPVLAGFGLAVMVGGAVGQTVSCMWNVLEDSL